MGKYEINQIGRAEEGHDWTYKIKLVFHGTKDKSNFLSITEEGLKKIKEILK